MLNNDDESRSTHSNSTFNKLTSSEGKGSSNKKWLKITEKVKSKFTGSVGRMLAKMEPKDVI